VANGRIQAALESMSDDLAAEPPADEPEAEDGSQAGESAE
jgi:hypothetical protein